MSNDIVWEFAQKYPQFCGYQIKIYFVLAKIGAINLCNRTKFALRFQSFKKILMPA